MTINAMQYDLSLVSIAKIAPAKSLSLNQITRASPPKIGYIAGSGDGIVTARSKPASREILLMDANSRDYRVVSLIWSNDAGHYMFTDLDPDKQYLIIARDYNKEFEPFAYDYVTPATDITPAEQHALRESWAK